MILAFYFKGAFILPHWSYLMVLNKSTVNTVQCTYNNETQTIRFMTVGDSGKLVKHTVY